MLLLLLLRLRLRLRLLLLFDFWDIARFCYAVMCGPMFSTPFMPFIYLRRALHAARLGQTFVSFSVFLEARKITQVQLAK